MGTRIKALSCNPTPVLTKIHADSKEVTTVIQKNILLSIIYNSSATKDSKSFITFGAFINPCPQNCCSSH